MPRRLTPRRRSGGVALIEGGNSASTTLCGHKETTIWKFDQSVIHEITSRRRYGKTTCAVMDRAAVEADRNGSVGEFFDAFVARFSFRGLGDDWIEVSLADAKTIAREILWKDLAYDIEMMPEGEALALAERFLALFGPEIRCYTNGDLIPPDADRHRARSWSPITEATFDTGVVCFDRDQVGILWVQDED